PQPCLHHAATAWLRRSSGLHHPRGSLTTLPYPVPPVQHLCKARSCAPTHACVALHLAAGCRGGPQRVARARRVASPLMGGCWRRCRGAVMQRVPHPVAGAAWSPAHARRSASSRRTPPSVTIIATRSAHASRRSSGTSRDAVEVSSIYKTRNQLIGKPHASRVSLRLPKHVTCLRFVDIPLYIVWKKEPLPLQFLRSLGHGLHVSIMILIALFERATWIVDSQPLCLSRFEGDMLTIRFTAFVLAEAFTPQCPAGGGGDRRLDRRQADAGQFVAVLVHLRYKERIGGTSHD